jgi:hypothetical protein
MESFSSNEHVFIYTDVESSYKLPDNCVLISIGAITTTGEEFYSLINPKISIDDDFMSFSTHKIRDSMLVNEPSWEIVGLKFFQFIEKYTTKYGINNVSLVFHNGKSTDVRKIRLNNSRIDTTHFPKFEHINAYETMDLKKYFNTINDGRFGLGDIYETCFNEKLGDDAHDALKDAKALKRICEYEKFGKYMNNGKYIITKFYEKSPPSKRSKKSPQNQQTLTKYYPLPEIEIEKEIEIETRTALEKIFIWDNTNCILDVKFRNKDDAKQYGASWDGECWSYNSRYKKNSNKIKLVIYWGREDDKKELTNILELIENIKIDKSCNFTKDQNYIIDKYFKF